MNRLLVILCPVNPRTLHQQVREDLDVVGPEESFRWCLIDQSEDASAAQHVDEGTGTLSNLPFADEALVLIPTVDVLLVHTKVPLISGKKLEGLLPTLVEPYLLEQRTPLHYQLLPPTPGRLGSSRTIAITNESWMQWLYGQLDKVPVRTLTLIPDCLLLSEPDDGSPPVEFLVNRQPLWQSIATREGIDWGSGWVESSETGEAASLSDFQPQAQIHTLSWTWLVPRALNWRRGRPSINLIPRRLSHQVKEHSRTKETARRWQPKIEWALWQRPLRLVAWIGGTYMIGCAAYLGVLAMSNWRWQHTLADAARPHLATPVSDNTMAIATFIQQATSKAHAQGRSTSADFVPMAGKLQILLSSFPAGLLDSVDYKSNGLSFTLRNVKGAPTASALSKRATELEIALVALGKNEYRILPFAGLPMAEGEH